MTRVTVTGASSIIGHFLLPTLESHNARIRAVSRNPELDPLLDLPNQRTQWLQADIETDLLDFEEDEVLIHLAPIWTLPSLLSQTNKPPKRLIAFSSTSHFTKRDSKSSEERALAQRLSKAETSSIQYCHQHNIAWTLFRPTLVYGAARDQNVTQIASFISKFGFFPILGKGNGQRMPVHAADLAIACIEALKHPVTQGQAYNLPGGEALNYRHMVERIFHGLDKPPRILPIPQILFSAGIQVARLLPSYRGLKPEMAQRMNIDLVFDANKALSDFGYHPREFLPHPDDMLRT